MEDNSSDIYYHFNFFDDVRSSQDVMNIISRMKSDNSLAELQSKEKIANYFKCMSPDCAFSTNEKDSFLEHQESHIEDNKYCCYCLTCFSSGKTLIEHLIEKHGKRCFQCSNCFYRATASVQVKFHIKKYHSDASILICPSGYTTNADDQPDFSQTIDPYECINLKCAFSTFSSDLYYKHLQSHGVNICYVCEVPFNTSKLLKAHQLEHNIGQFQCPYCRFGSKDRDGLLNHQSLFHPDNTLLVFDRNYVPKSTTNGSSLSTPKSDYQSRTVTPKELPKIINPRSLARSNKNSNKVHNAEEEGETDVMSLLLNPEMSIEVDERRLELNENDNATSTLEGQTNSFPRVVDLPYRTYNDSSNSNDSFNFLQTQMLNELSCDLCNVSTKDFNAMKRHLNIAHNKTMIFTCEYCDEPGKTQDQIKIHIKKSHPRSMMKIKKLYSSKIYFFSCPFCKYYTDKKVNFRNHLCMELGNEGFVCTICKASTTRQTLIVEHLTETHGEIHANDFLIDKESLRLRVDQIMPILSKRLFPDASRLLEGVLIDPDPQTDEITVFSTLHFTCPECTQKFRLPLDLNQHITESHIHHLSAKLLTEDSDEFILGIDEIILPTNSKNKSATHKKVTEWIVDEVEKQKHDLVDKLKQVHSITYFSDNKPPYMNSTQKSNNTPKIEPSISVVATLRKKPVQPEVIIDLSDDDDEMDTSSKSTIIGIDSNSNDSSSKSSITPKTSDTAQKSSIAKSAEPFKLKCGHCPSTFTLMIQANMHHKKNHENLELNIIKGEDSKPISRKRNHSEIENDEYDELYIIDDSNHVKLTEFISANRQLRHNLKIKLKNILGF